MAKADRDQPRGREAAALARVLARESAWLARAADDAAAAERAARGLAWLGELAQAFAAPRAAEYFTALGERTPRQGALASAAWGTLGAPLCARLATEAKRARSLDALSDTARDWDPHVDGVRAFEEPAPVAEADAVADSPAESAPESAPTFAAPADAAPEEPTPAIYLAVAAFAGDREPRLSLLAGRVEIEGEHPPGAIVRGALEELEMAARAEGAVLEARARDDDGLAWRVVVRPAEAAGFVFVDGGAALGVLAISAHRVVLRDDGGLLFGHGLRRAALDATALGEGRFPAGLGLAGETAAPDGGPARILEVVDDAATLAWLAPLAPPAPAAPAEPVAARPEPLQPPPVPADNPGDAVRPPRELPITGAPRRALVADDSVMARVFLTRLLVQEGIAVEVAENGADARALLAAGGFDLVFLDVDMPGGGALEIARGLEPAARLSVCALVKDDDERARVEAEGLGPALLKPFAEDEVRAALLALRGASTDNP